MGCFQRTNYSSLKLAFSYAALEPSKEVTMDIAIILREQAIVLRSWGLSVYAITNY